MKKQFKKSIALFMAIAIMSVGLSLTAFATNPLIRTPASDNLSYSRANLTVSWQAVAGATYHISMRDLTANMVAFSAVSTGTSTSYTIDRKFFYEGHNYRIAVCARVGTTETWGERLFSISLSSARQTILTRAQNMNSYTWTPTRNLTGWGGQRTFTANVAVRGIPYTQQNPQCSSTSAAVNWVGNNYFADKLSLSDFFTNTTSASGSTQPRYGSDCSGYSSIAWNITRKTTSDFGTSTYTTWGSTANATSRLQQLARLSPGDMLNAPGNHCYIVKSIAPVNNASGVVTSYNITVLEQTPPISIERTFSSTSSNASNSYVPRVKDSTLVQDYSWSWN